MPSDDADTPITPCEANEAINAHDRRAADVRERLTLLRRSLHASLDGDHERAAQLLDTLDDMEADTGGDADDR